MSKNVFVEWHCRKCKKEILSNEYMIIQVSSANYKTNVIMKLCESCFDKSKFKDILVTEGSCVLEGHKRPKKEGK